MADETKTDVFLFDDFFVDDADAGVVHNVVIRGRVVPITTKRDVTLADKEAAEQAAVKRHLDPTGRVVVDGIDGGALAVEVLVRCIKSWPFTFGPNHPQAGKPVPITRDNIRRMVSDAAEALAQSIVSVTQAKQKEADGPFEAASDAA
jgi:hypothetical protein